MTVAGAEGGAQATASVDERIPEGTLTCPSCSAPVAVGERFCEACGADLGPPLAAAATTCRECGGEVAEDGYCTQCGSRAASPRNHFTEQPAAWVAGVCDRGVRHTRNEDAMALHADPEPGGHAVLVVCDGVSSSTDSDVASLAAAGAARDVLATRRAAGTQALETAADAANGAVIAHTAAGPGSPASCTLVAAVLDGARLDVGWVGDSRAYWLPDAGEPLLLTTDDSFAAEQIANGVPRAEAESGPHAHAITRWLGTDAPDHTPRTASLELATAGWVLVCSDGLWNYCSEAADLEGLLGTTRTTAHDEPLALAGALVDWANAQGGQDNVTVALARVGAGPGAPTARTVAARAPEPAPHREEVRPHGNVLS